MDTRRSRGWDLALSILFYLVCAPLITRFVAPNGLAAVLLGYPLYVTTWLYGRKQGFVAAAAGVAFQTVIWFAFGDGGTAVARTRVTYLVTLFVVECAAVALFVLLVGNMKQASERSGREIERSRYRSLVELAPEAVFVLVEGKLAYFNNHALEMLGYSRDEMSGLSMRSILHEDDLARAQETFTERVEGQTLRKSITRIVRKDGSAIWVETTGQQIQWEGRRAVLYFSSDVGERLRAEEALRESEKRYRDSEAKYRGLVEVAPEGICVVKDARVAFCNANFAEMLGYPMGELIGLPLRTLNHPDDREAALARYASRAEGKLLPKSITRQVRKDGMTIWVETIGRRLEWDGTSAVLYFCSDVSDRLRAEAALRESEERYRVSESKYRNLIQVAPEAICVVEHATVTFCNSHLAGMLGYPEGELPGMPLSQFIYKEDFGWALERYESRTAGNLVGKSIVRHVKKDGRIIWVETVGQRIEWEGRPAVLYFSSDITERKLLEEQFVQGQKMEAIGRLAGGMAHDFNNMLQVILGFVGMMRSYPEDRNAILSDLKVVEESALRAASLTQQLLAFSRKQMIQPKVIDLGELVRQSEKMLSRVLGDNITLDVVLAGEESRVKADPGQLQQVIMNLVINARDAMPSGGRIRISVENASSNEGAAGSAPAAASVRLSVKDTGTGMDEETLGRIFEPFFTTKPHGTGTGLGLSIVYGIVRQNGGDVEAHSKVGKGTTFVISLPRVFEPTEAARTGSEEGASRGSGSILVVEDQASVRHLVRVVLERAGYAITEAASGEEAVEICRDRRFDALITDVVLTGMGGEDVARAVNAVSSGTQVIFMSGYVDQDQLGRLKHAPLLHKPFTAAQLLERVKSSLAKRAQHEPAP